MKPENEQCPVCGYYCLGKGGKGCIDKPSMLRSQTTTNEWVTYETATPRKDLEDTLKQSL